MDKGVDQVRKSIERRRKMRQKPENESYSKHVYPPFPTEEEKHGYFPSVTNNSTAENHGKKPKMTPIMVKGILSLLLFVGSAFVLQAKNDLFTFPKNWTNYAMTEEFPFARVHNWYQESFGSPMVFSPDEEDGTKTDTPSMPVDGSVTETFQTNGNGIKIKPEEATEVTSLRDGIVVFAGNDSDTDDTVIVQHADGSQSTYGYLDDLDVHVYQSITAGEELGAFKPTDDRENIFFAIEEDNQYIDPVEVIKVDDAS